MVAIGDASISRGSNTYFEFAAVRYNLNGTLDTSFGGTGEVTTILTTVQQGGVARDVVIQPDGKIVADGVWSGGLALVRYNANGSLDTTFGPKGTGIALTNINFDAGSLGLEPDGKIVVAGATSGNPSSAVLTVARYTAGGLLDTSFGAGGEVTTTFLGQVFPNGYGDNKVDLALDVSPLDPNAGKIDVVAHPDSLQFAGKGDLIVRYNSNGSLDTSFAGGAGYDTLSNLTGVPSVAIQPNGQIIVASNTDPYSLSLGVDRLNPDGSFDTTFGSGGMVAVSPPANTSCRAREVTLQSDGKIVVAGGAMLNVPPYGNNFAVARFNSADGSLDTLFGTGGFAFSSGINAHLEGVALEPDGRIVVAGINGGFALARFLAYGPQIGSFTASPNPVTAGSSLTLTASNISDEIPSATITQVAFYVSINGTNTLLGYGTQSTGTWSFTFSTVGMTSGTYKFFAVAEDSYSVFGDPFAVSDAVI